MMDAVDRKLIVATQAGLPLEREPYRVLADEIGVDEACVIARLKRLLANGAIRRIGAIPNHYALGFTANGMSVWDVAEEAVADIGARVGAFDFSRIATSVRGIRRYGPTICSRWCTAGRATRSSIRLPRSLP
jgi:siroheme decarboxylase